MSKYIFGSDNLFFPLGYGKNNNEPADIAWVIDNCIILMYMTAGKKRFERKTQHNLRQLKKWLRDWKSGHLLRSNTKEYSFDDIEYIIGLSIVDGDDSFCEYYSDKVTELSDYKVVCCAGITEANIRVMSENLCFPRDILKLLQTLRSSPNGLMSEADMNHRIRIERAKNLDNCRNIIHRKLPNNIFREDLYLYTINNLRPVLKMESEEQRNFISDLCQFDIIYTACAIAILSNIFIKNDPKSPTFVAISKKSTQYKLTTSVAYNMTFAARNIEHSFSEETGFYVCAIYDIGITMKQSISCLMAICPPNGQTQLEIELLEFIDYLRSP